ncbi:uncharacterized protein BX663DRAFT_523917 [Cokeromyces recurvatus]|uniref:uncharacterized protein n=1 Tax=Cokeromyces recurvatus TaxID=90255 RepID=UPI00221EA8D1|nr:uncharacterized protein BX663DRAFT_523917 [Cokeromyces recurvatus]KAI7898731.1 hypothetical protein BX663DRAFT_523917 [Cokeromyces recurvatus]
MYSFDFAIQISRICMDEIQKRGLSERKILRKSVPNGTLILKVFRKHNCTPEDLTQVSIHSVATLMQDIIWCCHERLMTRKIWRTINYETCTLDELSQYITKKGKSFLLELLDFLIKVMQYKDINLMDAYRLGEAMGKIVLGPLDCDPILAEKANHFLTRMIIEHSKNYKRHHHPSTLFKLKKNHHLSRYSATSHLITPTSKTEAAKAKTKSYNRLIQRIQRRNFDWISIAHIALYAMLENDYKATEESNKTLDECYISIFSTHLDPSQAHLSPLLYRLITTGIEGLHNRLILLDKDPFNTRTHQFENQICVAFDDFIPLIKKGNQYHDETNFMNEKTTMRWNNKIKSIPLSMSHMKRLYLKRQPKSSHTIMSEGSTSSDEETIAIVPSKESQLEHFCSQKVYYPDIIREEEISSQQQAKGMMKMITKMGNSMPIKKDTVNTPPIYY